MTSLGTLVFLFVLPIVVMAVVTLIVSAAVRRSPATTTWKATRDGVLFVVGLRRWQRVLIRTIAIVVIVVGGFLFLVAITAPSLMSTFGMGIAGIVMVVVGILGVWLAHGMRRMRLEVTPDILWVFPMAGAPREVAVNDVSELAPLLSNNFGGVVLRAGSSRVFNATRVMNGYPQLIDYFSARRPDLPIPDASRPL